MAGGDRHDDSRPRALLRRLDDPSTAPAQRLLDVVRMLDLALVAADAVGDDVSWAHQAVARAVIALAPLVPASDPIASTTAAALDYATAPSSDAWSALVAAATDSYPFGPGDGCLAVDELGGHGVAGAGDRGPGFVWSVAQECGVDSVCVLLRDAIATWVEESADAS
jgi:hypothetical protein